MKPLRFHPSVQRDINEAMEFYYQNASERVALGFWEELSACFERIANDPEQYPVKLSGLRRCNLKIYPFNVLFENLPDRIRVQVVRHNLRRPDLVSSARRDRHSNTLVVELGARRLQEANTDLR